MTDDFAFKVGESYTHCVIVTSKYHNTPIDLTNGGKTYDSSTAGTADGTARVIVTVFTAGTTPEAILTKDTGDPPLLAEDITLAVNPLAATVITPCAILINLTQADAATLIPGSYTYEARIVLKGLQKVVYPLGNDVASFMINGSETWDATASPPAPRTPERQQEPTSTCMSESFVPQDEAEKLWAKARSTFEDKSKRRRK